MLNVEVCLCGNTILPGRRGLSPWCHDCADDEERRDKALARAWAEEDERNAHRTAAQS